MNSVNRLYDSDKFLNLLPRRNKIVVFPTCLFRFLADERSLKKKSGLNCDLQEFLLDRVGYVL